MEAIEQVLANAEQGDSAAFRQLYDYSYETVYGECIKNLHNPLDAEDVTQDSYLTIYRRLKDVKDPQKFLGWCRRIAHNASVDYIRKHQRKAGKDDYKPPVSDETFEGMDQVAGEDTDLLPEEQAEQDMIHELLQTAMDDIAPQRATCLALYQQGTPYKEIAQMLSLPVGTVKSNVYYAKKALRKKIEEIEHKEHVQIHGFTLIPVAGGGVKVQMDPQFGSAFISAESSAAPNTQEQIWNRVSSRLSKSRHPVPTWVKIGSGVLIAAVILIGVLFALHFGGQTHVTREGQRTAKYSTTTSRTTSQRRRRAKSAQVRNNDTPEPQPSHSLQGSESSVQISTLGKTSLGRADHVDADGYRWTEYYYVDSNGNKIGPAYSADSEGHTLRAKS